MQKALQDVVIKHLEAGNEDRALALLKEHKPLEPKIVLEKALDNKALTVARFMMELNMPLPKERTEEKVIYSSPLPGLNLPLQKEVNTNALITKIIAAGDDGSLLQPLLLRENIDKISEAMLAAAYYHNLPCFDLCILYGAEPTATAFTSRYSDDCISFTLHLPSDTSKGSDCYEYFTNGYQSSKQYEDYLERKIMKGIEINGKQRADLQEQFVISLSKRISLLQNIREEVLDDTFENWFNCIVEHGTLLPEVIIYMVLDYLGDLPLDTELLFIKYNQHNRQLRGTKMAIDAFIKPKPLPRQETRGGRGLWPYLTLVFSGAAIGTAISILLKMYI